MQVPFVLFSEIILQVKPKVKLLKGKLYLISKYCFLEDTLATQLLGGKHSLKNKLLLTKNAFEEKIFCLFKGDTRKSSWNPDIPRPLCVHSSPSYRAVALCEDCWWWLPPAVSSPPCSACHTYSTKPTWYKSILNSQGIDTWLYHTWLWCFILVGMLFFFKLNYMYMYLLHFITSTLSMEILS